MIRLDENGEPVSLIPHGESLNFWVGDDLESSSGGAMLVFPCFYSGFVELDDDDVAAIIDAAFAKRDGQNEREFALSSAGEFAQLDHEHCAVCRHVLTREHGRPMVLRIIVVRTAGQDQWGVFINHGSACWDCWRSLCAPPLLIDNERLWLANVDDAHLEYIEAYARKHLGQPPSDPSELRQLVIDMVCSMNLSRSGDPLLRKSVNTCPVLWDYRRLLYEN